MHQIEISLYYSSIRIFYQNVQKGSQKWCGVLYFSLCLSRNWQLNTNEQYSNTLIDCTNIFNFFLQICHIQIDDTFFSVPYMTVVHENISSYSICLLYRNVFYSHTFHTNIFMYEYEAIPTNVNAQKSILCHGTDFIFKSPLNGEFTQYIV